MILQTKELEFNNAATSSRLFASLALRFLIRQERGHHAIRTTSNAIVECLPSGQSKRTQIDRRWAVKFCRPDGSEASVFFCRFYESMPIYRATSCGDCPRVEVTATGRELPLLAPWMAMLLSTPSGCPRPADHPLLDGAGGENLWTRQSWALVRAGVAGGYRS